MTDLFTVKSEDDRYVDGETVGHITVKGAITEDPVPALAVGKTRPRPKPRKTEDEIRATTEHNRRALDAWLQARRARLNTTPPAPREPISTNTADLISENQAVELTGCTRTAIRRAVQAGNLQCVEVHKPMSTKRFFSRSEVTAWAASHQKDE